MVYAFFIQSVHPTFCQVLHSQLYKNENCLDSENENDEDSTSGKPMSREKRKEALQKVAERVAAEYEFLREKQRYSVAKEKGQKMESLEVAEFDELRFRTDGILPDLETGMFLLNSRIQPHFEMDKHVLWCAALNTAFVLILESKENRVLANIILKFLTKYLQDYVQAITNPKEILQKPDVIINILQCVMPEGQLRFVNHKIMKEIEKDLEKIISTSGIAKSTK